MPQPNIRELQPPIPANNVPARQDSWYRFAHEVITFRRNVPCILCKLKEIRTKIVDTVFVPRTIWNDTNSDRAEIMVVGRDPGREEDSTGFPFVGPSGVILAKILELIQPGSLAVGNVTRCIGSGVPTSGSIIACAEYLDEDIERFRPRVFLLLGNESVSRFGAKEKITSLHGREIKTPYGRAVAAFHPAYVMRNGMNPQKAYRGAAEELQRIINEPDWFG